MKTFLPQINLNLTGIFNYLTFILSFSVGGFVFLKNKRSAVNRAFFYIPLTGGLWLFCMGTVITASYDQTAIAFLLLSYLIAVPYISPAVYNFSLKITHQHESKPFLRIGLWLGVLISIFSFAYVNDIWTVQYRSWGRFSVYRNNPIGFCFFAVVFSQFTFYAILAFRTLIRAYRFTTDMQERLSLKIFLIGAVIGYTGFVDFFVAWKLPVYPSGYISFTAFLMIISYGIIRHQFLDVRLIIKKLTVIFLIYAVLILLIFPMSKFGTHRLYGSGVTQVQSTISIGILIGILLSSGPFIYAYIVRHSYWMRGHSTAGLVHELKSPLATIQGALGVMMDDLKESGIDRDKALEYLTMIENNTVRLDQFVRDLLIIAKDQNDSLPLNKEQTNISQLIKEVTSQYEGIAQQKKISIQLQPIDITADIDRQKIRQVISNVLSNAIKFSSDGIIFITCEQNGKNVQCSIKDQGKGISERDIERVFDKFFQADPGQKGTGIGLTIAKTWIEAHGGKIWADSEGEGKGSKFTFSIPIT